ncbi:MAG: translocation/assembly module TamB, partial [Bacteroidota bacterium]|nr:translocation/assembly module TamB [Bacteroidota bacterium]
GSGDFLNVKGEALLTAGIDKSGNVTLTGSYEIDQGSYELSFNFIHRKFNIQKGSKIIWLGHPTEAILDVTGVYVANIAPLDLVENEVVETSRVYYRQKLPFEIYLKMQGELLKPEISFDIVLPKKNYVVSKEIITSVETKLEQLRQEPNEINKQVFSVLLLNRFVNENPFETSTGAFSASDIARQSVSKILTQQLNSIASNLIQGVDINFDVVAADDYTSGIRQNRTDLNLALSKRLLNDRLSVSVGSNFELQGPKNSNQQANNIAGNIAVDYQLSRDGSYMLRFYRKNEYEGVIDGYIIETGLGFIITMDYDHFGELVRRIKEHKVEKRQIKNAANNLVPVADSTTNKN